MIRKPSTGKSRILMVNSGSYTVDREVSPVLHPVLLTGAVSLRLANESQPTCQSRLLAALHSLLATFHAVVATSSVSLSPCYVFDNFSKTSSKMASCLSEHSLSSEV